MCGRLLWINLGRGTFSAVIGPIIDARDHRPCASRVAHPSPTAKAPAEHEVLGCLMRAYIRSGSLVGPRKARSEEHTSELQSLMRISYAVFCLNKKKNLIIQQNIQHLYTIMSHNT